MKKKHLVVVALTPLMGSAVAPPLGALEPVDGPGDELVEIESVRLNRLQNAGFEAPTFDPWTLVPEAERVLMGLTDVEPRSGAQALGVVSFDPEGSFVQFDVPLGDTSIGSRYSLGVWVKAEAHPDEGDFFPGDFFPGDMDFLFDQEMEIERIVLEPARFSPTVTLATWADGDDAERQILGEREHPVSAEWTFVTTSFELPTEGYDHAYVEFYLDSPFLHYSFDDAVFIEGSFTTPEEPTGATAQAGVDSFAVSWEPAQVTWDGGAAGSHEVIEYHVTAHPAGLRGAIIEDDEYVVIKKALPGCSTTETSCVIEGLDADTEYQIVVSARNVMGWGDPAMLTASTLAAVEPVVDEQNQVDELAPLRLVQGERADAGQTMDAAHGIVARLYWAVLGRAPEAGGARFWFDLYDQGEWDLRRIARHFAESAEFTERFGADLDDEAFATLVYTNALGRAPDAEGLAWWLEQLDGGMSRAEMVLLISDSPEFRASHPMPWDDVDD